MERAGKNTGGFTSESILQNFSRENIDQIRNIVMQHEELFKEQVQALHKLYNVQKLAMKELQEQFHYWSVGNENQNYNPVLERKSSEVVKFNAQESEADSPVIHTQSPCACNEFTGSKTKNSFFLKTVERKNLSNSQNNLRKRIDLERFPEEYMSESDYQTVANDLEADPLQDFQQKNLPSLGPNSASKQSKTTIDSLSEKLSQSPQRHFSPPAWPHQASPKLKTPKQVADGTSILDRLSQDASKSISILGVSVQLPLHCKFIKESPDNLFSNGLASPGNNPLSGKYGTVCELVEGDQVPGNPPFSGSHGSRPTPPTSDFNSLLKRESHSNTHEKNASKTKSPENLTGGELNQEESFRNENENLEKQPLSEEACESIAAKILLSFAPSRSSGEDKWQCFQTQKERALCRFTGDSSTRGKRMNRSERIGIFNCKNNVDEVVELTKTVHGKQVQNPRRK
ncbi:uncharacterized protein [Aristolochia californica]|uniref:uncharacterized protein isoform X2 n=1 Tax=Aristolochia californica TaxID=171875 RepID=UPI0035E29F9D